MVHKYDFNGSCHPFFILLKLVLNIVIFLFTLMCLLATEIHFQGKVFQHLQSDWSVEWIVQAQGEDILLVRRP